MILSLCSEIMTVFDMACDCLQEGAISYKLDADSELRFEVDHDSVQLQVRFASLW